MQFAMAATVNTEDLLRILGQIPVALCALEVPSLRIVAANQAYAALAGATNPEDLVGSIPSGEERRGPTADLLPVLREAAAHGGTLSPREVETSLDGEARCFEVRCDPLGGPDAAVAAMLALVCDITAQRQAEGALRDKEYQYRTLFESNPHPMWVYDLETLAFLAVNDAAIRQYGYSRDEFLAMTIKDIRPPEDVPALLENVRQVTSGLDVAGVWRHRRKDGSLLFVEIVSHTITFQGRPAEVVLAHDITERKRAIQELEAAHQRVLRGEEERKRFYSEVIRAVTNDKLHLVDAEEIPTAGHPSLVVPLDQPANYSRLRRELREVAEGAGMAAESAGDLLLAVGEAATNAIKHATGSESTIYVAPDRVIVRVSDHGNGIQAEDLPGAILLPGFSTRISLGMGYTIMLQLADRVWLATSTRGTVVQLEKWLHPEEHPQPALAAAWEKL